MTNSRLIILIFAIQALTMGAKPVWYDDPVTLEAGTDIIAMTDDDADRGTVHVRIAASPDRDVSWGLIWEYQDSANYTKATLSLPKHNVHYDLYDDYASISIVRVKQGTAEMLFSCDKLAGFDAKGGFNSLKLVFDGERTRLTGGSSEPMDIYETYGPVKSGAVAIFCDAPVKCQRLSADFIAKDYIPRSKYTDTVALYSHLSESTDIMEGTWEYLDRSIDSGKAQIGGKYKVATIRNGDGYDIVYLSGADINKSQWAPLSIKARLHKTIFKGNYDMEWYTADGNVLDDDTNAQLSDDGAILTLRFPTLSSQIRLRRTVRE